MGTRTDNVSRAAARLGLSQSAMSHTLGRLTVRGTLALDQYAALDHLLVAPRGRSGNFVEEVLRRHGLARRIALTVPHLLAAALLVAESDLIVTLASRIAHRFAALLPLQIVALPFELEGFTVSQLWHERNQDDPGHAWLRQQLLETSAELEQK